MRQPRKLTQGAKRRVDSETQQKINSHYSRVNSRQGKRREISNTNEQKLPEVFSRLWSQGRKKEIRQSDRINQLKFEEQVNWFKTLKDSKLINPSKQLKHLIIKLSLTKAELDRKKKADKME